MRTATLQRKDTSDAGTFGLLTTQEGFSAHSLECPWWDNSTRFSCIPAGSYICRWHESPHFGWVYRLDSTTPRSEILIHPGNWAGDARKGFKTDSMGCILLGQARGMLAQQPALTASRPAIAAFVEHMERQTFLLVIAPIQPGSAP